MMVRMPARAGSFYPDDESICRAQADTLVQSTAAAAASHQRPHDDASRAVGARTGRLVGGIVPHAGWRFSGSVAGQVFGTLAQSGPPETIVLLGATHYKRGRNAWVFGRGTWMTPVGPVLIDDRLAERICGYTNLILDDPYAHEKEHSLEVQVPLIARAMPSSRIVPILVPPMKQAVEVGEAVGRTILSYGCNAVVVGSTDLTHYGPTYGMTEQGAGEKGIRWAKEENDRRMIDLMLRMDAESVVQEAMTRGNACGSGAIAATIAAARLLGAQHGVLLAHTCSAEIIGMDNTTDSVGYSGVVFPVGP